MKNAVRALGEVALRVNDLERSQQFYADVIGLELMRRFDHAAFFRIAEGYGGHTTVLALFDRQTSVEQAHSTVDHLAFTIALAATHEWVHWRSIYVRDPDGNTVEFVCYDPQA